MFYRTRNEILTKILESIAERQANDGTTDRGIPKTKIMFAAFISYLQLKKYIKLLLENKMIIEIPISKDVRGEVKEYIITEKGLEFIKASRKVREMVDIKIRE